jgi:hypothetical protein
MMHVAGVVMVGYTFALAMLYMSLRLATEVGRAPPPGSEPDADHAYQPGVLLHSYLRWLSWPCLAAPLFTGVVKSNSMKGAQELLIGAILGLCHELV